MRKRERKYGKIRKAVPTGIHVTVYFLTRILYVSEKNFAVASRVRFFNDIQNNDWDCVIMLHNRFGKIPQLQEIASKVWKKEEELKLLKSELAALDRKIQLELAPPTSKIAQKENDGQQIMPTAGDGNGTSLHAEGVMQIHSPANE